jgi:hypothetical protein
MVTGVFLACAIAPGFGLLLLSPSTQQTHTGLSRPYVKQDKCSMNTCYAWCDV